jgi:hypothetical protein
LENELKIDAFTFTHLSCPLPVRPRCPVSSEKGGFAELTTKLYIGIGRNRQQNHQKKGKSQDPNSTQKLESLRRFWAAIVYSSAPQQGQRSRRET